MRSFDAPRINRALSSLREPELGLEGVAYFARRRVRGRVDREELVAVDGEELVAELCVGGVKGRKVDFGVADVNVKLVNFRAKIKLDNCKINTYRDDHALHSSQPPQFHTSSDCSPSPTDKLTWTAGGGGGGVV